MRALAVLVVVCGCGRLEFEPLQDSATTPCTSAPVVEAIVSGVESLDPPNVQESQALQSMPPIDRSILFITVREVEPSPMFGAVMCELLVGSYRCTRTMGGTDYAGSTGTIIVQWTVITFAQGVRVQRGVMDRAETTATLEPVPLASSFVVLTGTTGNNGNSWGTDEFSRARLVDETTLEITGAGSRGDTGWQVVTFDGARVQRGTQTLSIGQRAADVAVGPTDPARAVLLASHTADTSVSALGTAWEMPRSHHVSAETLRFERVSGNGTVDVAWELIELPFAVSHATLMLPPGATTASAPTAFPTATSAIAFATGQALFGPSTGGSDLSAGVEVDLVGDAAVTVTATADMLTATRASAVGTAEIPLQAIHFDQPRCSP